MMRLRVVLLSYDEGCGPLARRSNVDCHGPEHLDLPTCSLELKSQVVKSKAPTAYQQKVIQDSYFPGFFSSEMPESQETLLLAAQNQGAKQTAISCIDFSVIFNIADYI